ncbi:tetratricopeptide repeat protein [Aquabacterium sp.]|uniref:tetratricopeptide repeat protein n=1 Tax=Aquabacterium sp. TaxID=1872578 RepID=UPI003785261E
MRLLGCGLTILCMAWQAAATPITPTRDDEVIERLPATVARTSASTDPAVALREARALLEAGRREGDPRPVGRALARLARWERDPQAPPELLLTLASAEQYLHQFERAIARLQALVQRDPRQAQAWLMLATLHRVQGRYAESDAGCRALLGLRAQPYAQACVAENQALRGETDAARQQLQALIAAAGDGATRGWLLTTLAELEQRAGRTAASDLAWRQALQADADNYTAIGYADFLLDNQRPREAWGVLQREVRSDAVLLRLAIAAQRAKLPEATALQAELRDRFALADQRIGPSGHERERAMMALEIEGDPAAALRAARVNVEHQREPLDILLLARCAAAAGDAAARREAVALATTMGLHDARLAAQ